MKVHDQIDPNKSIEFIYKYGTQYAYAKAELGYLEDFRKSKIALLMKTALVAGFNTIAAQEREALADMEYIELLKGIREAAERSEKLRWELVAAQARLDVWRSQEASNRLMDKITL